MAIHAAIREIVPVILGLALVMLLGAPGKVQAQQLRTVETKEIREANIDWRTAGCDAIIFTCTCKEGHSIPHHAWLNQYTFTSPLDYEGQCKSSAEIETLLKLYPKKYCEAVWPKIVESSKDFNFNSCSVDEWQCQKNHICKQ